METAHQTRGPGLHSVPASDPLVSAIARVGELNKKEISQVDTELTIFKKEFHSFRFWVAIGFVVLLLMVAFNLYLSGLILTK